MAGPATVGPLVASNLGIPTVDVGNPMLSMHSAREMCGSRDQPWMARVMAAYLGLREQAAGLGIDADRLAIGGDSAGANLSASVLHSLAASGGPMPAVQLLIYPGVDARLCSVSMQELSQSPLLPLERIRWYLDLYLPEGQDMTAPRFSPLYSTRLAGQPPAFVLAAGHDPLWDDGHAYAEALQAAGVPVELAAYPGQVHGFLNLTRILPQGTEAVDMNIAKVSSGASETGAAAGQVLSSASELARQASTLGDKVHEFLDRVRAA